MPEYLAPGVYVEETSFRAKSIEGVGTSTTAFVGPTRRGPIGGTPELVTSLPDFERIYGSLQNLALSDVAAAELRLNFVAHAARAYFDNGGSRLYVVRTSNGAASASGRLRDGAGTAAEDVFVRARIAGLAGNGTLRLRESGRSATVLSLGTAPDGSMLRIVVGGATTLYLKTAGIWADSAAAPLSLVDGGNPLPPGATPGGAGAVAELLSLSVEFADADGYVQGWDELGYGSAHPRYVGALLSLNPPARNDALNNIVWFDVGTAVSAFELQAAAMALPALAGSGDPRPALALAGGTDGAAPIAGAETTAGTYAAALAVLSGLEDVSIVAAPGSTAYADGPAIQAALIGHAERRRSYRIAVLDSAARQTPGDVRVARGRIDSKYAALYYPWVIVSNPLARPGRDDIPKEIALPPSGFVSGIYARNDVQRGVHKAPANEVVTGALRFESDINFAQQELLNPLGVNCLRYLSGRGYRLWGARLASSDPEWKYVSDRRYFNYLEASIDRGTQWAVFELNGERLWANVRQTISDFLYNEWRNGALLGANAEEAFFVRCDRSTMTQNDLDNGRLVCLIGVALIRPAEFVIFRIGQKTADARS
ncbi:MULTISPECIES: phage tail sheath subtilisin-like domain-containing protein [unclassified Rhizobacter]|uniref:phage tail sheath subtilisin-like domain-containing protein n=1 Tax=unclassified Rhizobacter TaxID=2640088 RepID=UPI000701373A|nr:MULTISPECIES: phage tail sheath subtilisin-like domain-containing protein [unclassified Rhizobacter]KQU77070.1 phage tail protein [Rhizobacter sp. Root29]KQW14235.1 phage tail protein [Rhizobacter sp. Root1238]KRB18600.1 phage tail protein [Rhizobacter sp. Root16D2]